MFIKRPSLIPLGMTMCLLMCCVTMLISAPVLAQQTTGDVPSVKLGMSTALTGPAADLGRNMKQGVEAALASVNAKGRMKLQLVVMDDAYEPSRTIPNMRKLVGELNVDAIIGNVGTPTAVVSLPIVRQEDVCFYGAYTGAGLLRRQPPDPHVFNYRASYAQETAQLIEALLKYGRIDPHRIAFFTQRDAYGDAGYHGAIDALKKNGFDTPQRLLHTRYERNSLSVERAVARILLADHKPDVLIMVGAFAPCAKFIRLARQSGIDALFCNVSFVGTESLVRALGPGSENVIITQVVPHPQSNLPVVKAYRRAMEQYAPNATLNFGSLEGYVSTMIFCKALDGINGPITRRSIIEALDGLGTFDIGLGVNLTLSPTVHQASQTVWPTIVHQQKVVPLDWADLSRLCEQMKARGHGW